MKIVAEDTRALSAEKRARLTARLREEVERAELLRLINRNGRYGAPNIYNGQREINLKRVLNAVKILCYRKNVYKTRLNKLLFYADFKHYQLQGQGITGLCYAHLPFGPTADRYEVILQRLSNLDDTLVMQADPSIESGGEFFSYEQEPDRGLFSFSELQVLIEVDAFFKSFTISAITNYSHEEDGYLRTKNGELISYEYAARLRI